MRSADIDSPSPSPARAEAAAPVSAASQAAGPAGAVPGTSARPRGGRRGRRAGVPKRLARRVAACAASLALAAASLLGSPSALADEAAPEPLASHASQPRYLLATTLDGRSVPVLSVEVALAPLAAEVAGGPAEGQPAEAAGAAPAEGASGGSAEAGASLPALSAHTASFTVDGCVYAIEPDGESVALVAVDPQMEGELVVPDEVADATGRTYTVLCIAEGAFDGLRVSKIVKNSNVAGPPISESSEPLPADEAVALPEVDTTDAASSEGAGPEADAAKGVSEGDEALGPEDEGLGTATLQGALAARQTTSAVFPYRVIAPSPLAQTTVFGSSLKWSFDALNDIWADEDGTKVPTIDKSYSNRDGGFHLSQGSGNDIAFKSGTPTIANETPSVTKNYLLVRIHQGGHEGLDYFGVKASPKGDVYFPTGVESVRVVEKRDDGWAKVKVSTLKSPETGVKVEEPYGSGEKQQAVRIFLNGCGSSRVTWDYNGGSGPTSSTVVAPYDTVQAPTPRDRSGYRFLGWYDSSGNKVADAGKVTPPIMGSRTYTAKWKLVQSALTFDLQGGTGTAPTDLKATYGSKVPEYGYAKPVKAGHTFLGFFDAETGGDKWYTDGGSSATGVPAPVSTKWNKDTTDATTLYAHWSVNTYAITLMANHSSSDTSTLGTLYYKYGESSLYVDAACGTAATSSNIPFTSWEGHTFQGYKTSRSGGTCYISSSRSPQNLTETLLTDDATWYANWTTDVYKVTLNHNGGTVKGSSAEGTIYLKYGTGWYSNAAGTTRISTVSVPVRSGWTFDGYQGKDSSGKRCYIDKSGKLTASASDLDDFTANTTFKAVWTRSVTLDRGGATDGSSSASLIDDIDGESMGSITVPTLSGWTFAGYYGDNPSTIVTTNPFTYIKHDGSKVSGRSIGAKSTLYAWWIKSVTLDKAETQATAGSVTSLYVAKGQPVGSALTQSPSNPADSYIQGKLNKTLKPSSGMADPRPSWMMHGEKVWNFGGYFDSDGNQYVSPEGAGLISCPQDMPSKLTARWGEEVTLNYENGASAPVDKETVWAYKGHSLSKTTAPSYSGWTFAGYYSQRKGEGVCYLDSDGSSQVTYGDNYRATSLFAKWTRTITLDPNGGNAQGSVSSIELVSGGELTSQLPSGWTAPTNRGKCFAGYYEPYRSDIERYSFKGELLNGVGDISLQNTPTTFYAKWVPIYEITLDKRGGSGGLDRFYVGYNTGFFSDAECTKELTWPIAVPTTAPAGYEPWNRDYAYYKSSGDDGFGTGAAMVHWNGLRVEGNFTPTTFTSDATLYASYEPKTIFVNWSLRGSTEASAPGNGTWSDGTSKDRTQRIAYEPGPLGDRVPAAPTRSGHQFVGWLTEPSSDGKSTYEGVSFVTSETSLPTSDTTYYARWREIVSVAWDTNNEGNGGCWDDGGSGYYRRWTNVLWGDPVTPIDVPLKRAGYKFLGWSTDQNATQPDEQYVQEVTSSLTYYAVWEANDYTLTLDANGGSWAQGVATPPTINATYDSYLPTEGVPVPTWTGRKFLGYNDKADGTGTAYYGANQDGTAVTGPAKWDKTAGATLYAQWQVIEYPITYACSLCEERGDDTVRACPHMDVSALPSSFTVLELEDPDSAYQVGIGVPVMAEGYRFDGWWALDAGSDGDESGARIWEVGRKRFEARIVLDQFTVHLDAAGGTFADGSPTAYLTYTIEDDDVRLEQPSWGGHTFAGWVDEQGEPFGGTIPTGSTGHRAYTATWSLEYYPIGYDLRGGRFPDGVMVPYGYSYDSPDVPLVAPIRAGYHFVGWLDADNQDADPVIDLSIPTHSWGEKKFIATWEAVTYLIQFDMGLTDAAWEPDDQGVTPPNPMEAVYDQPVTMPRAPKRPGYIFKGWGQIGTMTGPSGAQETVVKRSFEPGKAYQVNFADAEGATVTLTGLWERNLAASVPVEIDLKLFANYGTGQFEVGPESEGSDVGTFENRSSGELKVMGLGEVADDGAFAQERRDARLEAFGSAANLAQVQLTLQPLNDAGEPDGMKVTVPLGGQAAWSIPPNEQGISYAPGWMMAPGGRLVVGYGLDTGSLQVHELKRDLHKPMAKLSYTLALVNP